MTPTAYLSVFSGTRLSGAWAATPGGDDDEHGEHGGDDGQRHVVLVASERHDDERDLEAFEQHALEAT